MTTTTQAATASFMQDTNTFLKLLATQVRNQDPLNPMDTSQFTQQLATFAEVEQSIAQSGKLDQMISLMQAKSLTDGAGLIGQQVTASAASIDANAAGPVHWLLPTGSAGATAEVTDASGKLLWSKALGASDTAVDWAAPGAGTYALRLRGADGTTSTTGISIAGTVGAVEQDQGQLYVRIGVARVAASAITALQPAATASAN
jgi:flagellar basal-body rod modification protein FlgD